MHVIITRGAYLDRTELNRVKILMLWEWEKKGNEKLQVKQRTVQNNKCNHSTLFSAIKNNIYVVKNKLLVYWFK
jgi:hypothetical protein